MVIIYAQEIFFSKCVGEEIAFTSSSKNISSKQWSIWAAADGVFKSLPDFYYLRYEAGTNDKSLKMVRFYLKSTDPSCLFTEDSVTAYIVDPPVVDFYADPPKFKQLYGEYEVKFHNTSKIMTSSASYVWNFGDSKFSFQKDPIHAYKNLGTYSVDLKVTDLNNCSGTLVRNNYINIVSLPENYNNSIVIYPNPSDDKILVQSENLITSFEMYNSLGELVLNRQEINAKSFEINSFNAGVYLIRLTDSNGNTFPEKVIFR